MMRFFNWFGGIAIIVFFAWLVYAVNNYGNGPQNEYVKQMVSYLEETYDEKFVVEEYFKGSKMFPNFLGSDMIRVHPKSNENIPFYTLIVKDGTAVEDFYVHAFYNYAFTEKYKQPILDSDSRKKYVQMHVTNPPISYDRALVKQPIASVVQTHMTPEKVYCYVVVAVNEDEFDIYKEAKLLADTYNTLLQATDSDFMMNVGYVSEKHFKSAVEMTRAGHEGSVDLMMLPEGYINNLVFARDTDVRDIEYFKYYLNRYY